MSSKWWDCDIDYVKTNGHVCIEDYADFVVALDDSIHMERRRLKSEGDGGDIIPFKTRKSPVSSVAYNPHHLYRRPALLNNQNRNRYKVGGLVGQHL